MRSRHCRARRFCESCHESFIQVSKFLILVLITLALSCFFAAEYYAEDFVWPWPIFIFYSVVFLLTNAVLMKGAPRLSFTIFLWGAAWMGGALFIFFYDPALARDEIFTAVNTFGTYLFDTPLAAVIFWPVIGFGLVILLIWMSSRYTFSHAYRIVFVGLAAFAITMKFAYPRLMEFDPFDRAFSFLDQSEVLAVLDLAWLNLLRVLAAEMVVYSMVKSYHAAAEAFAKRKLKAKPAPEGRRTGPADQMVETIYTLALTLGNGITRFYIQIEHTFLTLFGTLRQLGIHIGNFVWIILRDLAIPVAALTLAAIGVYRVSTATGAYINEHHISELGVAFLASIVLLISQIAFLSSKCRIHPGRLLSSHLLLLLWFSPYLLTLFIFVSISLWAVGRVLVRWNDSLQYGFGIGPVTIASLALTFIVLIYAVIRRHGEGDEGGEETSAGE